MTKKSDDGRLLLEVILVDGEGDDIEVSETGLIVDQPGGATSTLQTTILAAIVAVGATAILILAALNGTIGVIDFAHREIHEGNAYTLHFENVVTNIGEMTMIAFNAPTEIDMHVTLTVESTHLSEVFIYKDTSLDVDEGTEQACINRNQTDTPKVCTVTSIEATPAEGFLTTFDETQAAGANLTTFSELDEIHLLGGEGPKAVGADHFVEQEWIFNEGIQFAIVIVAGTDDNATHIIRIDFYEE